MVQGLDSIPDNSVLYRPLYLELPPNVQAGLAVLSSAFRPTQFRVIITTTLRVDLEFLYSTGQLCVPI